MKITTSLLGYLIRLYDKEEISLSRLAEMVNEKAELNWTPTAQMPNYDGDYLCHIEKNEVCGAINYYQRVINCQFNKWVIQEGETVTHWQHLPQNPNSKESNVSSQEPLDEAIEARLLSMMKDKPAKLLMYFLSILCREMVKTNADTLELSQHMDCEGNRYKIKCEASLEPLNATASKEIGEPLVQNKSNQ